MIALYSLDKLTRLYSELTTVWSAMISHQFLIQNKACTLDIISSSAHLISLVN
jgi:hypothetical protein